MPVAEVLGMIPKNLKQHLEATSVTIKVELSRKAVLLGTGRLLREVLEASGSRLQFAFGICIY